MSLFIVLYYTMGVKTRRLLPNDLIHKGGRVYAKRGKQNHRVCSCRVFYMNCVKCNDKYARRKSDYMTVMVKHARETSIKRKKSRPHENHEFNDLSYYKLVLTRIQESKMMCECTLCLDRGIRQKLSIRGPNKMSMDRVYDDMGYTHENQHLRLISKAHHSSQKRDAVPISIISNNRKWSDSTVSGIIKRSRKRYDRTEKEISQMKNALLDVSDMLLFLNSHLIDRQNIKQMINRLQEETPNCRKCNIPLDYGDTNGYLVTKNNPRQASPDRLNDRIGYIPGNVQMVCCACQTMGEIDDAEDIFLDKNELLDLENYLVDKIGSLELI